MSALPITEQNALSLAAQAPLTPNTEHPTPPLLSVKAVSLAKQIKEAEAYSAAAIASLIAIETAAQLDKLLAPAANDLETLEQMREDILRPYQGHIQKIQAEANDKAEEAFSRQKEKQAQAKALRAQLADLLYTAKEGAGVPEEIKTLVLVEARTLEVADTERAFKSVQDNVKPERLHIYFDANKAATELVAAMVKLKEGNEEDVHKDLATDFPGWTLTVSRSVRINAVPDLQTLTIEEGGIPPNTQHPTPNTSQIPSAPTPSPIQHSPNTEHRTPNTSDSPPDCACCNKRPAIGLDTFDTPTCAVCGYGCTITPLPAPQPITPSTISPSSPEVRS